MTSITGEDQSPEFFILAYPVLERIKFQSFAAIIAGKSAFIG
jgi:hypothetical protein